MKRGNFLIGNGSTPSVKKINIILDEIFSNTTNNTSNLLLRLIFSFYGVQPIRSSRLNGIVIESLVRAGWSSNPSEPSRRGASRRLGCIHIHSSTAKTRPPLSEFLPTFTARIKWSAGEAGKKGSEEIRGIYIFETQKENHEFPIKK